MGPKESTGRTQVSAGHAGSTLLLLPGDRNGSPVVDGTLSLR